jgi:hypothetical protein
MLGSATTLGRLVLAMSRPDVLPSVSRTTSPPVTRGLSRLNSRPVNSPVDASPMPSRATAHDSGSCRSLVLDRDGLAPSAPRRSPGASTLTPATVRLALFFPEPTNISASQQDVDLDQPMTGKRRYISHCPQRNLADEVARFSCRLKGSRKVHAA